MALKTLWVCVDVVGMETGREVALENIAVCKSLPAYSELCCFEINGEKRESERKRPSL